MDFGDDDAIYTPSTLEVYERTLWTLIAPHQAYILEHCLRFQSTLARLWGVAARAVVAETWSNGGGSGMAALTTDAWLATARNNLDRALNGIADETTFVPALAPLSGTRSSTTSPEGGH